MWWDICRLSFFDPLGYGMGCAPLFRTIKWGLVDLTILIQLPDQGIYEGSIQWRRQF